MIKRGPEELALSLSLSFFSSEFLKHYQTWRQSAVCHWQLSVDGLIILQGKKYVWLKNPINFPVKEIYNDDDYIIQHFHTQAHVNTQSNTNKLTEKLFCIFRSWVRHRKHNLWYFTFIYSFVHSIIVCCSPRRYQHTSNSADRHLSKTKFLYLRTLHFSIKTE